jgi:hypothetical protein
VVVHKKVIIYKKVIEDRRYHLRKIIVNEKGELSFAGCYCLREVIGDRRHHSRKIIVNEKRGVAIYKK